MWTVTVFGGVMVFVTWKLMLWGLGFLYQHQDLPHVLPIAYAALGVNALAFAWWGVALWRTGIRAHASVWKFLACIAALLCALVATVGTTNMARLAQDEFSSQRGGLPDR